MGKTIYDVRLADLIPDSMAEAPDIAACCAALDVMSAAVTGQIGKVVVLAAMGRQPSDVTDLLAVEQQTPYYDQSLPLEVRRNLLENTGRINSIRGTRAAVEMVLREVFGSGTVQRWYEYGGKPYHFRVLLNDFPDSVHQTDKIKAAVEAVKARRSVLDDVIIIAPTTVLREYTAGIVRVAVTVRTAMAAVN